MLKPDGSLAAEPRVANASPDPLFQEVAATAIRAVKRYARSALPQGKHFGPRAVLTGELFFPAPAKSIPVTAGAGSPGAIAPRMG